MIIKQITVVLHNLPGNNICFLLKPEKTSDLCMYCFLVVVVTSSRGLNLVSILVFPTTISNTVFLIYQCKEEFWGNKQEHSGCLLRLLLSSSPNVRKLRTDRLRSCQAVCVLRVCVPEASLLGDFRIAPCRE